MEEAVASSSGQWRQEARRLTHERPWIFLLAGAALVLAMLLLWSKTTPQGFATLFDSLVSTDIEQSRIDTALPAPQGDRALAQTFSPRHDGLSEIEVTLVQYGDAQSGGDAQFLLQLFDSRGDLIAEETYAAASISHNQEVRLSFPPLPDSEGQRYRLLLSGTPDNQVSAWAYSLDTYADGDLHQVGSETAALAARDLRFVTRYELTWPGALGSAAEALYYEGLVFLAALLLIPLPGVLLLLAEHAYRVRHVSGFEDGSRRGWDPAAWWGAALALGLASWPLLWSWLTMIGLRWSPWLLILVLIGGWGAAVIYWERERGIRRKAHDSPAAFFSRPAITRRWQWDHLWLLAILLLGLLVRLIAVRDTPVLPWVDASRHGLITAIMAQTGQVIAGYEPFLAVDRFPYHFGFHTLSSSLLMLTDWPLERLLLYLGQLLNGLIPLTIFAAVWLMIQKRSAGYLAAFLVALPFFFPAYYTTWGRLTQLTAVLLLPVLLAFTWQLLRGGEAWSDRWWLLGVLAAGLFLIHFRVLVYYLPFPLLALLINRFRRLRWLMAAAVLAFILALPRLFGLLADTNPLQNLSRTIAGYNNFPTSYLTTGWEQLFLGAAAVALLIALIAAVRGQKWALLPLVLAGWVAGLFALLSLDRLGLAVPSLVNLNSMYIVLFVPLALLLAVVYDQVWSWLMERRWSLRLVSYGVAGAVLAVMLLYGIRRQVSVLNLQTILVQPEDMLGLRWLDENLPPEALVAVNSWRWLGETWASADGGAWILPLTGRSQSTPPIDYVYNAQLFSQVKDFNTAAAAVSDWSDPLQAQWLREQGVTHLFVGKRGGFFDPAKLAVNPRMEKIFDHDGVFIFAVGE